MEEKTEDMCQGTGSEDSKDRVFKLRTANKYRQNDMLKTYGGKSEYDKKENEYGKFKSVTSKNGYIWNRFILMLRDNASRNYSPASQFDYFMEKLRTKEGSASFIKYLYTNGFDPQSR